MLYREQAGGDARLNQDGVEAAIVDLLRMTHEDGLELAYIAQNAKDRILPLLRGRREGFPTSARRIALRRSSNAACTAATCCTR